VRWRQGRTEEGMKKGERESFPYITDKALDIQKKTFKA